MAQFNGTHCHRNYFEGWYLKNEAAGETLALIPAYHIDQNGVASASIQVITNDAAFVADFPARAFCALRETFCVRIDENYFSKSGLSLNLTTKDFSLHGSLRFGPLLPPRSDFMGPFRFVPGMQCNHGVLSFAHSLSGTLRLDGKDFDFTGGTGYIEKDWGSSFPKHYLWTQCSWDEGAPCCVMVSIADIPLLGGHFTGCLCGVFFGGKEYRLATYKGLRVLRYTRDGAILQQGDLRLELRLLAGNAQTLRAPQGGDMRVRSIEESAACRVRYRFFKAGKLLFDHTSRRASFESCLWDEAR